MKAFAGALVIALSFAASSVADVVATWTFETNPPADLSDSTTIGGILADVGVGTASGVHASSATDWTTPAGNGSFNSLSSNTWATGDYYQFLVSTLGRADIIVSWDQTRSGTGPATFDLAYSTDGTTFTTALDNYAVVQATWSSVTPQPTTAITVDLSAISAIENAATLYLRLISQVSTAAAGTNRVDNFSVVNVPEASSVLFGMLACTLGGVGLVVRRRLA